ncbi:uncharacterized protein [Choristoneura fumiferana]|uniref:uncharacterized protein n=1 Tax=Choristoneura fumiferana TaxID=7141 RepID=UPI003D15765D
MAFYNKNIAKNKTLRKAWRAGHQIKLEGNEEICLPEICSEIGRWMRRDRAPRNRLSLRSFSVMLYGAIRLYRDEVNNLLSDASNLSWIKKRTTSLSILHTVDRNILTSDFSDNSEEESFVLMPRVIQLTEVAGNNSEEINTSFAESTEVESNNDSDEDFTEESTVFTVLPEDKQCTPKPVETKEQGGQTSPCFDEPERDNCIHDGFDANLPFGYIIVHDNYHSRIPSKIFFTSLNENVRFMTN